MASPSAIPAANQVHVKADYIENDKTTGIATARGDVQVQYQNITITTDELRYDRNDKHVLTDRPFVLTQAETGGKQDVVKGTGLDYDLKTGHAIVKGAFLTAPAPTPGQTIFIAAGELESFHERRFEMKDGTFTTCDYVLENKVPHYNTTSQRLIYVPGDHIEGWNSWVYVNGHPIFWLPYFYIPLRNLDNNVTIGHNDIEGWYLRSSIGYNLTPFDYGSVYVNPSFRRLPYAGTLWWPPGDQAGNPSFDGKGLGIGFDNVFTALASTSVSTVTLYGLPKPDTDDEPLWTLNGLDPAHPVPFQDHFWRLRQQNQFFGSLTTDLLFSDRNLYDLSKAPVSLPPNQTVDQFLGYNSIRDNQAHNSESLTDSIWGLNWSLTRDYKELRSPSNPPPGTTLDHHGTLSGTYGGTSFSLDLHNNDAVAPVAPVLPQPPPTGVPAFPGAPPLGAVPVGIPTATGSTENNSWTDTANFTQVLNPDLKLAVTLNHKRIFLQNTTLSPATSSIDEELDPPVTLTQNLGWGTGVLTYQKHLDFSPGAYLPATVRSRSYINKLPEYAFTSNPLFDPQPFTLNLTMGRYFEAAAYQAAGNPYFPTLDSAINRINAGLSFNGKPEDVGLLSKLNFAGTSFQQYVYSTGDAQYLITGKVNLETDFTQGVINSLTYTKTAADTRDNSPFVSLDKLSLSQTNQLNGSFNVTQGSALTWNNTYGYDYIQHSYLPLTSNLTWAPNGQINLQAGSGYTFPQNLPYLDFADGTISPLTATLNFRSTPGAFGGVFGLDHLTPGWSLANSVGYSFQTHNFTQLQNTLNLALGSRWQDHYEIQLMGYFDLQDQHYHPGYVGIFKDLHDFVLGVNYNQQLSSFNVTLQMIAFGTNLVNLGNSSFGGTGGLPGVGGLPGFGGVGGGSGTGTYPGAVGGTPGQAGF